MEKKLKKCQGECDQLKVIWKNHQGIKYCKDCWFKLKPAVSIKKKSVKREIQDQVYSVLRRKFLSEKIICQIRYPGCTINATDVHHSHAGDDRDEFYLDTKTWFASCRACHSEIHLNSRDAREQGFLK